MDLEWNTELLKGIITANSLLAGFGLTTLVRLFQSQARDRRTSLAYLAFLLSSLAMVTGMVITVLAFAAEPVGLVLGYASASIYLFLIGLLLFVIGLASLNFNWSRQMGWTGVALAAVSIAVLLYLWFSL